MARLYIWLCVRLSALYRHFNGFTACHSLTRLNACAFCQPLQTLNECDTLRHLATMEQEQTTTQAGTSDKKQFALFTIYLRFYKGKNAVIPFLIFFIILLYLSYIF
jgi:hypothetical protein